MQKKAHKEEKKHDKAKLNRIKTNQIMTNINATLSINVYIAT